jgi:hypothetical protein
MFVARPRPDVRYSVRVFIVSAHFETDTATPFDGITRIEFEAVTVNAATSLVRLHIPPTGFCAVPSVHSMWTKRAPMRIGSRFKTTFPEYLV